MKKEKQVTTPPVQSQAFIFLAQSKDISLEFASCRDLPQSHGDSIEPLSDQSFQNSTSINNNGGSVSATPLSFLSGYTVTAPRLVRIKSGVDRLMAYSDLDKGITWPSASLSVIDSGEVTNYEVGYHPHVRETATGVVKKTADFEFVSGLLHRSERHLSSRV